MFSKKNAQVEEQIMQDIADEQLDQVTGGGLTGSVFGTVTGLVSSVSVSGVQVGVAGVTVSTPEVSTDGLISSLL